MNKTKKRTKMISHNKSLLIKKLLARKHAKDFFMCEVKTGQTWGGSYGIVDAFAMKKSWAHEQITIYEIKVNRQDFLKDDKWLKYIPFCNSFYFICPEKLIDKDEVPKQAGLYWITATNKVKCIKKAPYNNEPICNDIFRYVLMNRLDSDNDSIYNNKQELIEEYFKNKKTARDLSWRFKSKLIQQLAKAEESVESYKVNAEKFKQIQKICEDLGISSWAIIDTIKAMLTIKADIGNKSYFKEKLKRMMDDLQSLINEDLKE